MALQCLLIHRLYFGEQGGDTGHLIGSLRGGAQLDVLVWEFESGWVGDGGRHAAVSVSMTSLVFHSTAGICCSTCDSLYSSGTLLELTLVATGSFGVS